MDADEVAAFEANPGWADAVALRRWDDEAKVLDLDVGTLDQHRRPARAGLRGLTYAWSSASTPKWSLGQTPSIGSSPTTRQDSGAPRPSFRRQPVKHVVDAALLLVLDLGVGVGVRPGVAGAVDAGRRPGVAEHEAPAGHGGLAGEHADLVAVRLGVEVAAQDRRVARGVAARR